MQHVTYLLVLVENVQCFNRTHGSSISPHTLKNGYLEASLVFSRAGDLVVVSVVEVTKP